jgi:hypothetical protein
MRLRRKKPHDSLYMLLDTMCNAFGGIILLAVLVVLLTNQEKQQSAQASGSQEALHLQVTQAQKDLQDSLQLEATLQAKANDNHTKEQMGLLSTRKDLQDAIQNTRDAVTINTKDLETANATDPGERLNFLNSELASAQQKKMDAQNGLQELQQQINHFKEHLADMEQQVAEKLNDMQRPLRLPMEHQTDKQVLYLIARFGRLYPCGGSDSGQNSTDIHWTSLGLDAESAEPIPGKGLAPNETGAYFRGLQRDSVYVVFITFDDSFPAFIYAKQQAVDYGISYGWEPRRVADGPTVFGAMGHTPAAQ